LPHELAVEIEADPVLIHLHAIGMEVSRAGVVEDLIARITRIMFAIPVPDVNDRGIALRLVAIKFQHVDLGRVVRTVLADQPEGGPEPRSFRQPGPDFEIAVLLREAVAFRVYGGKQSGLPRAFRVFSCLDAENSVLYGERKTFFRIGKPRAPKVAGPGRMGNPAGAGPPRRNAERV